MKRVSNLFIGLCIPGTSAKLQFSEQEGSVILEVLLHHYIHGTLEPRFANPLIKITSATYNVPKHNLPRD